MFARGVATRVRGVAGDGVGPARGDGRPVRLARHHQAARESGRVRRTAGGGHRRERADVHDARGIRREKRTGARVDARTRGDAGAQAGGGVVAARGERVDETLHRNPAGGEREAARRSQV